MYPRSYYETYMSYEASDKVFVAMPFGPDFNEVYEAILAPAISGLKVNDRALRPMIVNRSTAGAADIHERIMDGILHSRLVIADMTVQSHYMRGDDSLCWQPNANVAYEVGLAAAWRNPEDILLIHRARPGHTYSFDVQSLRHVEFDPAKPDESISLLRGEMLTALRRSRFIADKAFARLAAEVTSDTAQYMHREGPNRAFPVISFRREEISGFYGSLGAATSQLQQIGALKARNVVRRDGGEGIVVFYQWTDLGLRLMQAWKAIDADRCTELRAQIASVPDDKIPPVELRSFPEEAEPPAVTGEKAADPEQ